MNALMRLIAIALLFPPTFAFAQSKLDSPPVSPTARDLYIGCSLYLRGTEIADTKSGKTPPYSALACGVVAFNAFGYSRSIKPGNEWEYCIPENAGWAADPVRALATAYVDTYERLRFPEPNKQGLTMMLYMFKINWPCANSK